MGLLDRLLSRQIQTTDPVAMPYFFAGDIDNVVTTDEAYRVPAVWEAVSLISRSLARLPLYAVRPTTGDKVYNHSSLARLENSDQDAYLVRQTLFNNLVLHGEAFARIVDTKLIPLRPGAVAQVNRDRNGDRFFRMVNGQTLTQLEVFHVIGGSLDGVRGLSPLTTNGLTLNLARAVDEYGQKFFNQRRPVVVINTQGDLDAEAAQELAQRFYNSSDKFGAFVADRNTTLTGLTGTPNEAQFNETRQSMVLAVSRVFGIPPSKLGVLDYSTFNNITEENISFVRECLSNYAAPFESAFQFYFGSEIHHDYTELLEQSFEERATAAVALTSAGILTVNEARARLNYPQIEGGDELQSQAPAMPPQSPQQPNETEEEDSETGM